MVREYTQPWLNKNLSLSIERKTIHSEQSYLQNSVADNWLCTKCWKSSSSFQWIQTPKHPSNHLCLPSWNCSKWLAYSELRIAHHWQSVTTRKKKQGGFIDASLMLISLSVCNEPLNALLELDYRLVFAPKLRSVSHGKLPKGQYSTHGSRNYWLHIL